MGRFAFAAVFVLLIVLIASVPAARLWPQGRPRQWWRNVRIWGIAVAATQLVLYLVWE